MIRRLALAACLALPCTAASAQTGARPVEIVGNVVQPLSLTIEALAARSTVAVRSAREHGEMATYIGPLLWPLLAEAHLRNGPERGATLQHVIFARGADGYAVAVAIGEIDPDFADKPVIIALQQDGASLPQPRLVVPGDRKPGRAVRDLVTLEVR